MNTIAPLNGHHDAIEKPWIVQKFGGTRRVPLIAESGGRGADEVQCGEIPCQYCGRYCEVGLSASRGGIIRADCV